MPYKIKFSSFVLLLCLLVSSCEGDPTGTNGVPSNITGKIILTNIDTQLPLTDHSGVTVAIQGTMITTTTTPDGAYTLRDVPPGVYVVIFAKDGFDSLVVNRVEYSGVGVEFLSDHLMYTLTAGTLTLDPILQLSARELALSMYDDPRLIRDTIRIDTFSGKKDTTIFVGDARLDPDAMLYVVSGTAQPFSHVQVRLVLSDQTGMALEFRQTLAGYSEGEKFVWVLDASYLGEYLNGPFQGNSVSARLTVELIGQEVWSNAQPVPVR